MSSESAEPTPQEQLEDLRARLAVVEEENERLREEYARARQSKYRKTALAMVAVGLVGIAGGALFETARTVLLALGGTGVFAGVLTYYLTPERFLAASVGEAVFDASADNAEAITEELGLQDTAVYIPGNTARGRDARLFVPKHTSYSLPDEFDALFVTGDDDTERGVALTPTATTLLAEFENALAGDLASGPNDALVQLTDALESQFELVENTRVDVEKAENRATVGVNGPAYGRPDRFDHPVASFIGVGLASALDQPVTVETTTGDDRMAYLVTASWQDD
ncbi:MULTISPECIES: hypothetical protein [unclassified Haladaptatus]|uniref:hypothetical protein n=1 Tax=unclassified Haladaptatus TaxID=2622732 RepID=UPI0023E8D43B|nr:MULTISPECIES: hypothetical protein [unclassified Haladaptatus]